ncbi:hypothetical protein V6N12_053667 [Hibiscus sabdariffa]|uniref:Uncharacterized protein n=1 Tax=Hibiscus sabdariffa TaxID=183260 RepID=A0ABR2D890_9ROSI
MHLAISLKSSLVNSSETTFTQQTFLTEILGRGGKLPETELLSGDFVMLCLNRKYKEEEEEEEEEEERAKRTPNIRDRISSSAEVSYSLLPFCFLLLCDEKQGRQFMLFARAAAESPEFPPKTCQQRSTMRVTVSWVQGRLGLKKSLRMRIWGGNLQQIEGTPHRRRSRFGTKEITATHVWKPHSKVISLDFSERFGEN